MRAKLFALWTDRQRKAGRPEHELTQGAFADEMNHPLRMNLKPGPNRLM
jgi:hypothetical protein